MIMIKGYARTDGLEESSRLAAELLKEEAVDTSIELTL